MTSMTGNNEYMIEFEFLDDLRDSGIVNMMSARPYLLEEFPNMGLERAKQVHTRWMTDYDEAWRQEVREMRNNVSKN